MRPPVERHRAPSPTARPLTGEPGTRRPTARPFLTDPYPGAPKVLFIGHAESSHTHAWVSLVASAQFNVRLFALPSGVPPNDWPVPTYVTASTDVPLDTTTRERLYAADRVRRYPKKGYARFLLRGASLEERWLAKVIRLWQPDVIHTLGLDPASTFYHGVRHAFSLEAFGTWVLQLRGGADLALTRFDPAVAPRLAEVLRDCDQLLDDNEHNLAIARDMGVRQDQIAAVGTVPGTGGIDLDTLMAAASDPPSARRVIVWPKAYESPWSKALPVFEALTRCWERITPCEIHMLAADRETQQWFHTLPAAIKASSRISERIPHDELLRLMTSARVMLAPSLVDGLPNSLLEAMATGALPIVSPLATMTPVVRDGENGLFARNLYPDEIAHALDRAMRDDALVDSAARLNRLAVRDLADRATIAPRVRDWYTSLAASRRRS